MAASVMSGREVATALRAEVGERVAELGDRGKTVGLATILVGEDPASQVYVSNKHKAAEAAGMISIDRHLPATSTQQEVEDAIRELNADDRVDGMILQLPLPNGLDGHAAVEVIDPAKDADGLHPHNLGLLLLERPGPVPATPQGIMKVLEYYDVETSGKTAVVIGRSFLVGRPMALLLGGRGVDATVTITHSRTKELDAVARSADILVVAIGRPEMVTADMVKPGAVVIDVGINRTDSGLIGDVAYDEVAEVAGAITPVPGGVGPMTIASLMLNTVEAAERSAG